MDIKTTDAVRQANKPEDDAALGEACKSVGSSIKYPIELQHGKTALEDLLDRYLKEELRVKASITGQAQDHAAAGPGHVGTPTSARAACSPCSGNVPQVLTHPVTSPELPPLVLSLHEMIPPRDDILHFMAPPPGLPPPVRPVDVVLPSMSRSANITCAPQPQTAASLHLLAVSQQVPQDEAQAVQQKHPDPQPQPRQQHLAYVNVPNGRHEVCPHTNQVLASIRVSSERAKGRCMKFMETVLFVSKGNQGHGVSRRQENAVKMWLTFAQKVNIFSRDDAGFHLDGEVFNRLGGCTKYMVWMYVGETRPCGEVDDWIPGPGWYEYGVNDFQERTVCCIGNVRMKHLEGKNCFYLGMRLMPVA